MRYYDEDEAKRLEPEPWMVKQLALNPSYVSWGPHEDYMWNEHQGWDSPLTGLSWSDGQMLDELNEIVNFYFTVERPAKDCETCAGNGTHPDSQWISESFYEHSSPFRGPQADADYADAKAVMARFGCKDKSPLLQRGTFPPAELLERYGKPFFECCVRIMENNGHWDDDITEDEASVLVEEGRGHGAKTASEFNSANRRGSRSLFNSHDAINRWILIKQRLKRLGMPESCQKCKGDGDLFIGPARLDLILWKLHPRKGCSRGIEIQNIQESDLPAVYSFLREAATRNAERFAKVVGASIRFSEVTA